MSQRSADLIVSQQRSQILPKPSRCFQNRERGREEAEAGNQVEREDEIWGGQEDGIPDEQEGGVQLIREGANQAIQEGVSNTKKGGINELEREGGNEEDGHHELTDAGYSSLQLREQFSFARLSFSSTGFTTVKVPGGRKQELAEERPSDTPIKVTDPIEFWVLTKRWPEVYFESRCQSWTAIAQNNSSELEMESPNPSVKWIEFDGFMLPCPVPKVPTIRHKQSEPSLSQASHQPNREEKSAPYRNPNYTMLLELKGSYLRESEMDIVKESKSLIKHLSESQQSLPQDSLFRDDLFVKTCRKLDCRNEARVIQDIGRLLVPSVESLATYGAAHLDNLIEGVNEAWSKNTPVQGPRPQPDYYVGFRRSAFTTDQLEKLGPLVGTVFDTSVLMATYNIYFPFFSCEVKCGAAALDIADLQNGHSMTVALRAIYILFKSVGRQRELNQKILTFSISHNHQAVRIYGHYPVVDNDNVTFFRHPIHEYSFIISEGKQKWTAYQFTKNVYDLYAPELLDLIRSAINDLPVGIDFGLSQPASFTKSESRIRSVPRSEGSSFSLTTSRKAITQSSSSDQAKEPALKKRKI